MTTTTAYNCTEVLANLVKDYKTTSQLKKNYSNLVNLYGKDEAVRLVKAFRASKESQVSAQADEVRKNLTLAEVMEFAFGKLDKGKKSGALAKLCKMGQTERAAEWSEFLAKFYPYTLSDGQPARAVWYTKTGTECYKVFEALPLDEENAIKILDRALENLERGAKTVWVSGKPRKSFTETHNAGEVVAVCDSEIVKMSKNEAGKAEKVSFKIERGESKDFQKGLRLTADYITVAEFTKQMNKAE